MRSWISRISLSRAHAVDGSASSQYQQPAARRVRPVTRDGRATFETLEDRRLLSAAPTLNGSYAGTIKFKVSGAPITQAFALHSAQNNAYLFGSVDIADGKDHLFSGSVVKSKATLVFTAGGAGALV